MALDDILKDRISRRKTTLDAINEEPYTSAPKIIEPCIEDDIDVGRVNEDEGQNISFGPTQSSSGDE